MKQCSVLDCAVLYRVTGLYVLGGGPCLCECEVWPRGWATGNSVMGAPILMYFSDMIA